MAEYDDADCMTSEQVIEEVLAGLSDKDIQTIRTHPSSSEMHFGLGLYIRNKYIHSGRMIWTRRDRRDPDVMSSAITEEIARRLLPEYNDYPLAFKLAGGFGIYPSVHNYAFSLGVGDALIRCVARHYLALASADEDFRRAVKDLALSSNTKAKVSSLLEYSKVNYPGEEPNWDVLVDFDSLVKLEEPRRNAEEQFSEEVADDMMSADGSLEAARASGLISEDEVDELLRVSRTLRSKADKYDHPVFLPPALIFLANPSFKGTERWSCAEASLQWFLKSVRRSDYREILPKWLFSDPDVALMALGVDGKLLAAMPDHTDDLRFVCAAVHSNPLAIEYASDGLKSNRDVLKAGLSSGFQSVLGHKPYSEHTDDDELVAIAVKASCTIFAYASERLRDDVDMAMLAIEASKNDSLIDNFYDKLGKHIRSCRDIVEAIAQCPYIPNEFPPKRYRDDDRVGELLADESVHGDHFSLYWMSRRIKDRYMDSDELERWGDDPTW